MYVMLILDIKTSNSITLHKPLQVKGGSSESTKEIKEPTDKQSKF